MTGFVPEIIKKTARSLRKNMTMSEKLLWKELNNKKINYKFLRQKPIYLYTENSGLDRYIIPDFCCLELKFVIEVDGSISVKEKVEQKLAEIGLKLNSKKTYLQNINQGVLFLGTYIKPYTNYLGNRTKGNFYNLISKINNNYKNKYEKIDYRPNINSYLGYIKHSNSYNFRKKILFTLPANFYNDFYISSGYQKIKLKNTLNFN